MLGPVGPVGVASGPDDELPPHAAVNSNPPVIRTRRELDTMRARIASGGPSLPAAFNIRARRKSTVCFRTDGLPKLTFLSPALTVLRTKPVGSIECGALEEPRSRSAI